MGATEGFTAVASSLTTVAVTVRTGRRTLGSQPVWLSRFTLQRCSGRRPCLQEETASLPCPHQGPGVCSYRGRKAAVPSHGRTAGRNLVRRAGPAGPRGGAPRSLRLPWGAGGNKGLPTRSPPPVGGGPRFFRSLGTRGPSGQQRVNPTLFHFIPGGVAVTPPGLGVTRHCLSP